MSEMPREVPSKVRRYVILVNGAPALVAAVVAWGAWVYGVLIDKQLFGSIAPSTSAAVCGVVSVVALIAGLVMVRRALHLAEYGVDVEGRICAVKPEGDGINTRVEYQYEVDGNEYSGGGSTSTEQYEVGGPVKIIVDPRRPAKSMLAEDVLPPKKA